MKSRPHLCKRLDKVADLEPQAFCCLEAIISEHRSYLQQRDRPQDDDVVWQIHCPSPPA
jgi:hypothetical protein